MASSTFNVVAAIDHEERPGASICRHMPQWHAPTSRFAGAAVKRTAPQRQPPFIVCCAHALLSFAFSSPGSV